jgi:glycosyltransferase involved in cell wall biosynthesis
MLTELLRPRQVAELARRKFSGSPDPLRADRPDRKLAYLTSEYPKVSHTFIRREIVALERRGWKILRMSIRGWNSNLVDPADIAERGKTIFALKGGALSLGAAVTGQIALSPLRFLSALRLALRMMAGSDRPFVWHLIYLAEACRFASEVKAHGIKHVHAHFGSNPAEVAMLLGVLAGVSYSVTVHGPEEFDRAGAIHLQEIVHRAAFVVAICSFGRSQMFRLIEPHYWAKIRVIYCGVDENFSHLDEAVSAASDRLVCVGRLCEQKGQLLLVGAAAALAREGRKFKLILVGDGEHRHAIERLIEEHDLGGNVEITGWASNNRVREEMLAARALVLPSFAEGLPIVIIEAMLLSRPVVTTYVAGIPELVVDGKAGWLCPAGSQEDLAEAMRACLDAPLETLRSMGSYARARALERHDLDRQADGLGELFESVLRRGAAQST